MQLGCESETSGKGRAALPAPRPVRSRAQVGTKRCGAHSSGRRSTVDVATVKLLALSLRSDDEIGEAVLELRRLATGPTLDEVFARLAPTLFEGEEAVARRAAALLAAGEALPPEP
jgi:hypothetical protein